MYDRCMQANAYVFANLRMKELKHFSSISTIDEQFAETQPNLHTT